MHCTPRFRLSTFLVVLVAAAIALGWWADNTKLRTRIERLDAEVNRRRAIDALADLARDGQRVRYLDGLSPAAPATVVRQRDDNYIEPTDAFQGIFDDPSMPIRRGKEYMKSHGYFSDEQIDRLLNNS